MITVIGFWDMIEDKEDKGFHGLHHGGYVVGGFLYEIRFRRNGR